MKDTLATTDISIGKIDSPARMNKGSMTLSPLKFRNYTSSEVNSQIEGRDDIPKSMQQSLQSRVQDLEKNTGMFYLKQRMLGKGCPQLLKIVN